MAKIRLRRARREDVPAIVEVLKSCAPDCDLRQAAKYYEERLGSLDPQGEATFLVGIAKGRVVGLASFALDSYETDDVFWLGCFHAGKDAQGRGWAPKLVRCLVEEIRQRGGRKLYTDRSVHALSGDADRRCVELGFEVEARLRDYHGEGADEVVYGMDLARRR